MVTDGNKNFVFLRKCTTLQTQSHYIMETLAGTQNSASVRTDLREIKQCKSRIISSRGLFNTRGHADTKLKSVLLPDYVDCFGL